MAILHIELFCFLVFMHNFLSYVVFSASSYSAVLTLYTPCAVTPSPLTSVCCPPSCFSVPLQSKGAKEKVVTRIIVSRCEVDLMKIRTEFKRQHKRSLYQTIAVSTSVCVCV